MKTQLTTTMPSLSELSTLMSRVQAVLVEPGGEVNLPKFYATKELVDEMKARTEVLQAHDWVSCPLFSYVKRFWEQQEGKYYYCFYRIDPSRQYESGVVLMGKVVESLKLVSYLEINNINVRDGVIKPWPP